MKQFSTYREIEKPFASLERIPPLELFCNQSRVHAKRADA